MNPARYLLTWPLANIRHRRWTSTVMVLGVALVAGLVTTLMGFVQGYEQAVRRDVDRMGFDLLITARGCPYEAATLMLRGGIGLRYMPDGVVARLDEEPEVIGTWPTLIHPVRDPGSESGMMLLKGVEPDLFEVQGLVLAEGAWLSPGSEGVVLGYEAAELEQRHAGDLFLIPGDSERESVETRVLGILERTGSQLDGSVLMHLDALQVGFGLENKLTGVGVKLDPDQSDAMSRIQETYDNEAELQVISLSTVVQALQQAMSKMRGVVQILAGVLALVAGAFLLNTGLLRSLGEHRQQAVMQAIGLPDRFVIGASLVENLVLVGLGAVLGVGLASVGGMGASRVLADFLPYAPTGNLVEVSSPLAGMVLGCALLLAMLATVPAWIRLRYFTDLSALRGA